MKAVKKIGRSLIIGIAMTGLAMNFNACDTNSPMSSQNASKIGKTAQSNLGTIHILQMNETAHQSLLKGKKGKDSAKDSVFYAEKLIKANKGGEIKVGNKEVGESKIKFGKHDLPEDLTIAFQWSAHGTFEGRLNNLVFGPHGTQFNKPVKVELSYKTADLQGVDEKNLKIFYFNEETGLWELVGGDVDKKGKKVKAYLKHFSRYAVAWSN